MVVIATVNLFFVVSSDEDQFRPPKTVKLGHEWEGGRKSLAEGIQVSASGVFRAFR